MNYLIFRHISKNSGFLFSGVYKTIIFSAPSRLWVRFIFSISNAIYFLVFPNPVVDVPKRAERKMLREILYFMQVKNAIV